MTALQDRRQLVDRDRLHVAVYAAGNGTPRWYGSKHWARRAGPKRANGIGGQLRLFGRVLEVILYS